MAKVDKPRYGVEITYNNGASIKQWFQTEEVRDIEHAQLNGRKGRRLGVRVAKRIQR
jgi:hypothetical protein